MMPSSGYNALMRRTLRSIARLMLAVLLATVLSPSFAWEATAGQAAHEHEIASPGAGPSTHDQGGYTSEHHANEDSHHHHGCAGHSLGDLPGYLGEASAFALPDSDRGGFADPAADFHSPFPDRLDRPPLAPTLA